MDYGFWLKILNGPRFGEVEEKLVGNYYGEVLGRSNGGLVGRSEKYFHSDHQTAPCSVMCELGDLVVLEDSRLLGYAKTKVAAPFLPRHPHSRMRSIVEYRP